MRAPDQQANRERYRRWAPLYDDMMRRYPWLPEWRRRAVALLRLQPGDVVADVGCGTGLSFQPIRDRIGDRGQIYGIDASAEMLAEARRRVEASGWDNVILIESTAERAQLPAAPDAALFGVVHDVMRSENALRNIVSQLRPRAHVAAFGSKWAPPWALPVNVVVWWVMSRYSATTLEGLDRPWSHLERLVPGLYVRGVLLGGGYLAAGTLPSRSR